jgi:hypothetical protein
LANELVFVPCCFGGILNFHNNAPSDVKDH